MRGTSVTSDSLWLVLVPTQVSLTGINERGTEWTSSLEKAVLQNVWPSFKLFMTKYWHHRTFCVARLSWKLFALWRKIYDCFGFSVQPVFYCKIFKARWHWGTVTLVQGHFSFQLYLPWHDTSFQSVSSGPLATSWEDCVNNMFEKHKSVDDSSVLKKETEAISQGLP